MTSTEIVLLIASLVVAALCSGLELAFVSSNKLYIQLQRKQGAWWALLVAGLLERPGRVLGTLLVGNSIALVVFGLLMAQALAPWLHRIHPNEVFVLVGQVFICTMIVLVVAEFLPKVLFRIDPNSGLALFAVPLRVLYALSLIHI